VAIQSEHRTVDLGQRRKRRQCQLGLRHPGHRRGQQRAGSALFGQSWIDSSGNLWLFGGYGYDSTGSVGKLNDLWQYSPSSGQWTWVGGEDAANASGSTARWEPPRPATCRERARQPAPGSTPPATCGCSAGLAMTQPAV
jgi:hypothetical protein